MTKPTVRLPTRAENANKGDAGDVLIVAGSRRLAGAAVLCGLGAGRAGAGFVRIATPASAADRVAAGRASTIVLPQRETRAGELAFSARGELLARAATADVLVLGPGIGRSEDLGGLVTALIRGTCIPLVLDADALFALGDTGLESLRDHEGEIVITPHVGEAARLLGRPIAAIAAGREGAGRELARRGAVIAVLKGAASLVVEGDRLHVNETGNSAMATAGMGDVLAGMIGALIASGMGAFDAAACGVHAHGRAGDLARSALGADRGLLASDLEDFIPRALAEFAP